MKEKSDEKRKKKRVHYGVSAEIRTNKEVFFAELVDITDEGMGFILPGKCFEGENVNIKIKNAEESDSEDPMNICVLGKVVWVIRMPDRRYRMGVRIEDIDNIDLRYLKKLYNNKS